MKVLVSGSTGLIGSHLSARMAGEGHKVWRLVRKPPGQDAACVQWDPYAGRIEQVRLDGVEAVVHLAGESLATGKWNEKKKTEIRRSRVEGTRFLCETLAKLSNPPHTLLCASAIGYYGSRGDEELTEDAPPGTGFLAEVCQAWEAAAAPAADAGIRVAHLRLGMVLSASGGALEPMRKAFRTGLGGAVGSGAQYVSWVHIEDVLRAVSFILNTASLAGPINVTAPNPATNAEFAQMLGKALGRPSFMKAPAFAVRLALGEMADEVLLASQRVIPKRLTASGFTFQHPRLDAALRHCLETSAT